MEQMGKACPESEKEGIRDVAKRLPVSPGERDPGSSSLRYLSGSTASKRSSGPGSPHCVHCPREVAVQLHILWSRGAVGERLLLD